MSYPQANEDETGLDPLEPNTPLIKTGAKTSPSDPNEFLLGDDDISEDPSDDDE